MDYFQINSLDYWSLVNLLMGQITPQTRKQILDKLTLMNNLLLPVPPIPIAINIFEEKNSIEDDLEKRLSKIKNLYINVIENKKLRRKNREKNIS